MAPALNRTAIARAVSIVGHPVMLVPAAGLTAASARAASPQQLQFIGGALLILAVIALGFSWFQVSSGRWSHVDASVRKERTSLNVFLALLFFLSALLLWMLGRLQPMAVALALSSAICISALLAARWVKVSLHTAFAAFATALVWPLTPAVVVGAFLTVIVVWSRLHLGRHVAADIVAGLLLGIAAGTGYQHWAA
jgi:membrane-associated phospholipid phosphatase